ncbi:50S ribosomal protein L15 [Eubacteriales bacterium OttesenSCG-928-M02]|nr:50S ribosomal protein L15 [Eubacteriales bacterium OttesenSCG-928-M02]
MNLHELKAPKGAKRGTKRVGRGMGSGHGKTSTRGHKGQWARSGGGVRPGFEGGQMPLTRRVPKRGFTNIFQKEYAIVNVGDLNDLAADTVVSAESLKEMGRIKKINDGLKILGRGEIGVKLTVECTKISAAAKEKIEAAGGRVEVKA